MRKEEQKKKREDERKEEEEDVKNEQEEGGKNEVEERAAADLLLLQGAGRGAGVRLGGSVELRRPRGGVRLDQEIVCEIYGYFD